MSAVLAARRMESAALRRLARATRPNGPHVLEPPGSGWARRALERARASLLSYPNVVGVSLGHRRKDGAFGPELCLTVFVERKLTPEELKRSGQRRLPRSVRAGNRRLPVDVVQLGPLRFHANASDGVGPMDRALTGTIGAFARARGTNLPVAITAMHITGVSQWPDLGPAPVLCSPSWDQDHAGRRLGVLERGTMQGVDAARIALDAGMVGSNGLPDGEAIRGWRPVIDPDDISVRVHLHGATSGYRAGRLRYVRADLAQFGLDFPILADIATQAGDSGAALLDERSYVLGFLVGAAPDGFDGLRVFCTAGSVLSALDADIPTQ